MNDKELFMDYYKILNCERCASVEELKKNYQRLILSNHPDKTGNGSEEKFHLIQKAWTVLRDPQNRKQYNAVLTCYENEDILFYNTISLSDMKYESSEEVYTYECRCSGIYFLEKSDVIPPVVIINCNECSFSIKVDIPV